MLKRLSDSKLAFKTAVELTHMTIYLNLNCFEFKRRGYTDLRPPEGTYDIRSYDGEHQNTED